MGDWIGIDGWGDVVKDYFRNNYNEYEWRHPYEDYKKFDTLYDTISRLEELREDRSILMIEHFIDLVSGYSEVAVTKIGTSLAPGVRYDTIDKTAAIFIPSSIDEKFTVTIGGEFKSKKFSTAEEAEVFILKWILENT